MTEQTPATYRTGLTKLNDTFMPMVESQLYDNGIQMTEYQRTCVMNSISSINEMLLKEGLTVNQIDQSNLTQILLTVASLQLNSAATPREVYFIKRGESRGQGNAKATVIEMGIEGDGNDALLSRFGRGIKKVHRHWEVKEDDDFTYMSYTGINVTPPTWVPKGSGKVVRVVYPLEYEDGQIEYFICEREDVKANLIAHMFNNLMWDKEKNDKKEKIRVFADAHSLDDMLNDKDMQVLGKISPAWKDPQSREAMIVRKMRNRIVKKIPKDFSNAYVATKFEEAEDDFMSRRMAVKEAEIIEEIQDQANTEVFEPTPSFEEKSVSEEHFEPTNEQTDTSEAAEDVDPYA